MINAQSFEAAVVAAFAPVAQRFDLRRDENVDAFTVRFVNEATVVEITYEAHRSHEMYVWVGRSWSAEPPLELADVLRACGAPIDVVRRVSTVQTNDLAVLARFATEAAAALERYAAKVVRDDESFKEAVRQRSERARAYTAGVVAAPHIELAERAWTEKDYAGVYAALEPVRESLPEPHMRRLAFAQKKLKGDVNR